MKYIFYTIMLLTLAGCGSPESENKIDSASFKDSIAFVDSILKIQVDSVPPDTIVKLIDTVAAEPKVRASFRITYTANSCGGARPTQEIVEQYGTPIPLASSSIKFKNHHTGTEYILKTDAKGEVSADIEAGKYDVFFTKDINQNLPHTGFDPKCGLWTSQLLLTVKVAANTKMQDVNVHFVCNPCNDDKMRQ